MHDITILRVTAQYVGDNLTESLWEDALVDVLDGSVYVLFRSTHAPHHVPVISHFISKL